MNQAAPEPLNPLDPMTLRLAQAQADAAGISVTEHLQRLIHAVVSPGVPNTSHCGGMAERLAEYTSPPAGAVFGLAGASYGRAFFRTEEQIPVIARGGLPMAPAYAGYDDADAASPALRQVSAFNTRINLAAMLLSAAFVEGAVTDFTPSKGIHKRRGSATWYFDVVDHGLERARQVRAALLHRWVPGGRAERLAMEAFRLLTELTPSGGELLRICQYDRPKAFAEMARQLDVIAQQIEHAARLIADVETSGVDQPSPDDRFAELRAALLEKGGGGLSLTEAAALLGVTRQAVHKRVKAGTVLGMMNGAELVLPRGQFVQTGTRFGIVPGLGDVLAQFKVAGAWSALQFLVEPDPNLAGVPLRALTEGRIEAVVDAAKAYLGIDED